MLVLLSEPVGAQQQQKIFKIGELHLPAGSTLGTGRKLFRQSLRKLGYIEAKNIVYETRSAQGKLERFSALAEELVRLKVDVLLTTSADETLAAKNATKTIPIVFFAQSDPVASGLLDSLTRRGGNITGVTTAATELSRKRLELLKATLPKLFTGWGDVEPRRPWARMERKPTGRTGIRFVDSFHESQQRR